MQPVPRQATCNQFRPIEPSFPLKAQVVNPKSDHRQPFAATRNTHLGARCEGAPGLRLGFVYSQGYARVFVVPIPAWDYAKPSCHPLPGEESW
jgi:hypothetical protein